MTAPPPQADGRALDLLSSVLRALAGVILLVWALQESQLINAVDGAAAVQILLAVAGVTAIALAFAPLGDLARRCLDAGLLIAALVAFAVWTTGEISVSPALGTDEIAYNAAAAHQVLAGHDPYGADLSSAIDQGAVSPTFVTYRLDGGRVTTLSYPSLAFLIDVPAVAAGVGLQAGVYVDAAAWIVAMLLAFLLVPRWARPAVVVLSGLSVFISLVISGLTDVVYLPFVIAGLWRWDRYGDAEERSPARWMGPIAIGLALAVKQSVWFLAPVLLVGQWMEGRAAGSRWRRTGRYLGVMVAAFLIPNLPFIVLGPGAWLHGILTPIIDPLVPYGQALIGVTTYLGVGGGDLRFFSAAGIVAVFAVCAALAVWYPALKRALPALPAVALLFPTRSLASYWLFALPGLLVAALTVRPAPVMTLPWRRPLGLGVAGGLAALACGLVGAEAAAAPPMSLSVTAVHATGELTTFDVLQLQVVNHTAQAVKPVYMVTLGPYVSTPWLVRAGPAQLAPNARATVTITTPNADAMPGISSGFQVDAFTESPPSISESATFEPAQWHTEIVPQEVDRPVSIDETLDLDVRVLDRDGNAVERAGIPVDLGQVLYTQAGVFAGEASINGANEGRSPVSATTDASGVAHFTVRAVQVQPFEVFFQAWLPSGYPVGYSNLVTVRFVQG